jgi:membrane-bound ClpP family serine protease
VHYFRLSSLILISRDLYVLSLGLIGLGGLAMLISGLMQKNNTTDNGFDHHERFSVYAKIMKQLAWVQFFSWFALFPCGLSQPLHNTFMAQQTQHLKPTIRVPIK